MRAPGIEFVGPARAPDLSLALRADIAGFAGIFERGPVLVPLRVEDWGEYRAMYGGFVPIPGTPGRQALSPLALHGFFQNGGGPCVLFRLASPRMRAATAALTDPATGRRVDLGASSPGAWANGVTLRVPLTVRRRARRLGGLPLPPSSGFQAGDLVRITGADGRTATGLLAEAPYGQGLTLPEARPPRPPLLVERLNDLVDVTIEGAGVRERFRNLSLLPTDPRYLWRFFAVRRPLSFWWTPAIPPSWQPIAPDLARALAFQGPAASALVRSELPAPDELPSAEDPAEAPLGRVGRNELVAVLSRGRDDLGGVDAPAFLAAFEALALHPAPSIVCAPELMLPLAPGQPACPDDRRPDVRLEPEPPPPPPCAPRRAPPPRRHAQAVTRPRPPYRPVQAASQRVLLAGGLFRAGEAEPGGSDAPEPASGLPGYGAAVAELQRALVAALAGTADGRERIALLDPEPGMAVFDAIDRAKALEDVLLAIEQGRDARTGGLGTLLYPWIRILDPLAPGRLSALVPPSGHVAGLLARRTRQGGPAARFANERLEGAITVERPLLEGDRADLNDFGVTAIRVIAGRGVVVFGERTMRTSPGPDRYAPGARVLAFLRRVLRVVGERLAFEPNDDLLRARARVALHSALRELFAQGAFAGASPVEAYAVRCDAVLNPPESVAAGRLIAEVDVALAVPLEFLTIRVALSRDAAEILDDVGAPGDRHA
ncbi:phage tail sheath subtilisin-like domain-containing protein [Sorangium sp. So ce281]|uniref:phage tail sheath subtilisin-like domain-containing protein n=1 Tax=unclassified Sorangium TaxID=2621164 RepID=UPI003F611342